MNALVLATLNIIQKTFTMYYPPNKYYLAGVIVCAFSLFLFSQNQPSQLTNPVHAQLPEHALKVTGKLPTHINEASGLAITSPGKLWTHNDDGIPVLFCIDSVGNLVKSVHINSSNIGWEDLALDNNKNLYIGAFGNNKNDRADLKILKIPNPETTKAQVVQPEIINFAYEDQHSFPPPEKLRNFDSDAFIALDSSLYIFTKNRTVPFSGFTKVYQLPNKSGNYKAILIDSIYLGGNAMMDFWVTGADVSPDLSTLVLLGHSSLWLISDFNGNKFSTGKITKLELDSYSHKAGISFKSDAQLYIVDENEFGIFGGRIFYLDLREILPKKPEN